MDADADAKVACCFAEYSPPLTAVPGVKLDPPPNAQAFADPALTVPVGAVA